MKIYRPFWGEGVFLTPQQFQQQKLWQAYSDQNMANMFYANIWGVGQLQIDNQALTSDILQAEILQMRFQDGTFFDSITADILPSSRSLSSASLLNEHQLTIYIGIPLLQANGANAILENQEDHNVRYQEEWLELPDLFHHNSETVAVERLKIKFLFDFENRDDYLNFPLIKLKKNSDKKFVIDESYIPPSYKLNAANDIIAKELELLCVQIKAKRERLMSMRHERNEQIADFAIADVSLFWLLNTINSFEPQIKFLKAHLNFHPEKLYETLSAFAGGLLTFSMQYDVDNIPSYQHEQLNEIFPPLFQLIRRLLEETLPSRVIKIDLEHHKGTRWIGRLDDTRLLEEADFYLSVWSELPGHELQSQFPILCKAGSPDDINQLVNSALSGIPIKPLRHVPAAIPMRLENQYFAMDLNNAEAKRMKQSRSCEFYVPKSLTGLSLELYAVLRS